MPQRVINLDVQLHNIMTMYITHRFSSSYCGQSQIKKMQVIFSLIKKRCPNGEINVLMTNDCKDDLWLNMWLDFGKSVLMSHFTTQIFITKMHNGNFQSTWKWLQCVVPTLNYQKIIGNTLKSSVTPLLWSQKNCVIQCDCDIKTDFPKSGHICSVCFT